MSYRRYVAACVLLAATVALAQQDVFTSANAVSFTISTDRNTYNSQERITVNYQVKNVSTGPLYVPKDQGEILCSTTAKEMASIMHVDAWFENAAGKDFHSGWLGGCLGPGAPPTFSERIRDAAVLLRPGEHHDGTIVLDGRILKLPPGVYRIVAKLDGWKAEQFSIPERAELSKMAAPFLGGELSASTPVTVTH